MPNTTIIMPGPCQNGPMLHMYFAALASCKATCDADLIFIDDNPGKNPGGPEMAAYCRSLGYRYHNFGDCEINNAKMYNWGRAEAKTEYIAYANADVLFFDNWLDNLIAMWRLHPYLYCMCPYAWSIHHKGLTYRDSAEPRGIMVKCDHPQCWTVLFKRDHDFVWDEEIGFWEIDCDLWKTMQQRKLWAGVAYNSRVDHLQGGVREKHNADTYGGDTGSFMRAGTEKFRKKWGIVT